MFGLKIKFEKDDTTTQTLADIKQAMAVSKQEFSKAYHRSKARSLQHSLNRLQELEGNDEE